jgi:hypothetical protein
MGNTKANIYPSGIFYRIFILALLILSSKIAENSSQVIIKYHMVTEPQNISWKV